MAAYGYTQPVLLAFAAPGAMISAGVQVVCGKTLGSGDMDAKMYNKVRTAEEFTANCESELESLNKTVNQMIKNGSSESAILNMLDGATGKNLQKLDESLKSGNILATTRAINYSRGDMERYIKEQCANREVAARNTEQAAQFLNLNFNPKDNIADSSLEQTKEEIKAYRQALQDAARVPAGEWAASCPSRTWAGPFASSSRPMASRPMASPSTAS